MAKRTISQIMGDYGLGSGTTGDTFARTEQSVLKTVQSSIDELRSRNSEINAAKGFGRSTFSDAIQARQEADILSPVFTQFAQARQTEDLNQAAFNRSVVGQGAQADIQSAQYNQSLAGSITQATEQQKLSEKTAVADLARSKELSQTQTQNQTQLLQTQGKLTSDQMTQQAQLNSGQLNQQYALESKAKEQAAGIQIGALRESAALTNTENANNAVRQQELMKLQGGIQSDYLSQQAELQLKQIDEQFSNSKELEALKTQLTMENMPEELRLKLNYQKGLLQDQLALQRQTAIENVAISTIANTLQNTMAQLGVGGLNNVLGDAAKSIIGIR